MAASSLFEQLGSEDGIGRIVDTFYDRVAADPEIRPVYPEDLGPGREKLKLFLVQWSGGPSAYSDRYGHPRLRRRHFPYEIGEKHAGRWLHHMRHAMREHHVPADAERTIFEQFAPLARHMVNAGLDVPREPLGDVRLD